MFTDGYPAFLLVSTVGASTEAVNVERIDARTYR